MRGSFLGIVITPCANPRSGPVLTWLQPPDIDVCRHWSLVYARLSICPIGQHQISAKPSVRCCSSGRVQTRREPIRPGADSCAVFFRTSQMVVLQTSFGSPWQIAPDAKIPTCSRHWQSSLKVHLLDTNRCVHHSIAALSYIGTAASRNAL